MASNLVAIRSFWIVLVIACYSILGGVLMFLCIPFVELAGAAISMPSMHAKVRNESASEGLVNVTMSPDAAGQLFLHGLAAETWQSSAL